MGSFILACVQLRQGESTCLCWSGYESCDYLLHVGLETNDVQGVMDGDLLPFMSSFLRMKSQQATEGELAAGAPTAGPGYNSGKS